jgi:hypothetical protein
MSMRMQREYFGPSFVPLTASASTTERIPYRNAAGGVLTVGSVAGGATTITWWSMTEPGATPVQILDVSGNAVTTTITANTVRLIPDSLYGCHILVPVLNAGTASVTYTGKS